MFNKIGTIVIKTARAFKGGDAKKRMKKPPDPAVGLIESAY